jgi:putative acetyltransferase
VEPLQMEIADPGAPDVRALVQRQLEFGRANTPLEHAHAVAPDQLSEPAVTLFCARRCGRAVGIAALREQDPLHGEIKSMHTIDDSRGQGVGRAMVEHLLGVARSRGYERVSLETGSSAAFAPARALYASVGFEECAPFGSYRASPHNHFMTAPLS